VIFLTPILSAQTEGSEVYGSSILQDPWNFPKRGDLWEIPGGIFKFDVVHTEDGKNGSVPNRI